MSLLFPGSNELLLGNCCREGELGSCQCGFSTTARNNACAAQRLFLQDRVFLVLKQYKSVALACSPHSKVGNHIVHRLLRATSSKVFVTTTGHEEFLSQAAMALTVVIAFIAVLITSVIVVFAL